MGSVSVGLLSTTRIQDLWLLGLGLASDVEFACCPSFMISVRSSPPRDTGFRRGVLHKLCTWTEGKPGPKPYISPKPQVAFRDACSTKKTGESGNVLCTASASSTWMMFWLSCGHGSPIPKVCVCTYTCINAMCGCCKMYVYTPHCSEVQRYAVLAVGRDSRIPI